MQRTRRERGWTDHDNVHRIYQENHVNYWPMTQDHEIIERRGRRKYPPDLSPEKKSISQSDQSDQSGDGHHHLRRQHVCNKRKSDLEDGQMDNKKTARLEHRVSPGRQTRPRDLRDHLCRQQGPGSKKKSEVSLLKNTKAARLESVSAGEHRVTELVFHLSVLKKNIFKKLPNSRLQSKFDSIGFQKCKESLVSFKVYLKRCLKSLHHCTDLMNFFFIAWEYNFYTPIWLNFAHNAIRNSIFQMLSAYFLKSLKCGNFSKQELAQIKSRLIKLRLIQSNDANKLNVELCCKYFERLNLQ